MLVKIWYWCLGFKKQNSSDSYLKQLFKLLIQGHFWPKTRAFLHVLFPHSLLLNPTLECTHLSMKAVQALLSTGGVQQVPGFAALLFSYNIFAALGWRQGGLLLYWRGSSSRIWPGLWLQRLWLTTERSFVERCCPTFGAEVSLGAFFKTPVTWA